MMKPKDRAKDLVDEFWMTNPVHNTYIGERNHVNAIKCALIHVDGIMEAYQEANVEYEDGQFLKYWEEVRVELINQR